jgi:hypothetical protein
MGRVHRKKQFYVRQILAAAVSICCGGMAQAYQIDAGPDWDVNLDNTLMYTLGWRAEKRDQFIANHAFFAESDYKFNRGDTVTNRLQDFVEFQGVYKKTMGFRVSGSAWNDWAYNDYVKTNPNPAFSTFLSYPNGHYSDFTKRYHIQGGEILDAFVFANAKLGETPTYAKVGKLTQYWGNAFFFGFSNIGYSQSPVDYIKGFSQPGSEVKELFLPRKQVLLAADLNTELSVAMQYFFQWEPNRYPEGGTHLAPFDIAYGGPQTGGALAGSFGGPVSAGNINAPKNNNQNYGLKVAWSPDWAGGELGFCYRQLDETHPWLLADIGAAGGGRLHLSYAEKVKLYGMSYEHKFGMVGAGAEISYRKDTGLDSALANGIPGVPYLAGATGDITNVIINGLLPLKETWLYDSGIVIAEATYTHLNKVTSNESLYNGVGHAACHNSVDGTKPGGKWDGCKTDNALAVAVLAIPHWNQVFPSWDVEVPISVTWGVHGNPAYTAGGFYAQGTAIYSIGVKGIFKGSSSVALAYNGYHWHQAPVVNVPGLGPSYAGFGGNGAVGLNDKGWVSLTVKTSF